MWGLDETERTTETGRRGPRRSRLLLGAVATALLAASAASAAPDPRGIALRQADFPAGATVSVTRSPASALSAIGRRLKGATFSATWAAGGTVETSLGPVAKQWHLDGDVIVARDVAAAKRVFALGKAAGIGFFSDVAGRPRYLSLPRYGHEQLAFTWSTAFAGQHAVVFVRKGRVVWQLMVGAIPVQWQVTRARVLEQIRRYARLQTTRVGQG